MNERIILRSMDEREMGRSLLIDPAFSRSHLGGVEDGVGAWNSKVEKGTSRDIFVGREFLAGFEISSPRHKVLPHLSMLDNQDPTSRFQDTKSLQIL